MVRFENVVKKFGKNVIVDSATFEVKAGELFFILGPSGCGKTTCLRLIAGFYTPDSGNIFFSGRPMNDVPPHNRNTSMVFQNYALWPHMTVEENVGYGLTIRKVPKQEKRDRVAEALEMVRMKEYAKYQPSKISGGQQQRVALARAIVVKPDMLLLDEPLSNLDAKLRLEMRDEIRRIHKETGITMVYVTHDQREAMSLADRICVINKGRIEQIGAPEQIYKNPVSRFVSEFIGEANVLAGNVYEINAPEGNVVVDTPDGKIKARSGSAFSVGEFSVGEKVAVIIRPEFFSVNKPDNAGLNKLECVLSELIYNGDFQEYKFVTDSGAGIDVKLFGSNIAEIKRGEKAVLSFSAADVLVVGN